MVEQYPGRVVNRKYSPCKEFLFLCASFLLSLSLGFTFTFCRPSPVSFLSKRIHRVQDQTYFLLHASHASCQWPPRVESSKSLLFFLKINRGTISKVLEFSHVWNVTAILETKARRASVAAFRAEGISAPMVFVFLLDFRPQVLRLCVQAIYMHTKAPRMEGN